MADTEIQNRDNQEVAAQKDRQDRRRILRPRCAITGNAEQVVLQLEMPGVQKDNLHMDIENNELRISGERTRFENGRYLVRERIDGDYAASYTLDETIDQERVDAELRDGVLTVTLHVKEAVKPRKITIRTK
jgi:HSP20 family protein